MKIPFFFYRKLLRKIRFSQTLLVYFFIIIMALFCSVYLFKNLEIQSSETTDNEVMVMINNDKLQKEFIDKKGVHVIVGQYVEKILKFEDNYNLTTDILNTNNYNPIPGAGENGQPVYMGEFEKNKAKILFYINKFNLVASDKISINRSLPDPRKESCKNIIYELSDLPTTSIIIVFHNEAWSTLLRTIHSVINRSPKQLIKQIILVDDASERNFLKKQLDDYIENLNTNYSFNVSLIRSKKRIGLIKARLLGTKKATGDVLTFLDAHVEVTIGWLVPLLGRIKENSKVVVCPLIDIINDQNFAYSKSFDLHWGGINWNLHFRWFSMGEKQYMLNRQKNLKYLVSNLNNRFFHFSGLSNQNNIVPFKSPIMAGGLFSVDKNYFNEIGLYDEEMDIWGGENIELSLRVWSCGGRIEIHPCSHVGHLFRKSSPYTFPREGGVSSVLYKNLARVIEVWMDYEYKLFFYLLIPVLRRTIFGELNLNNNFELMVNRNDFESINQIINNSTLINLKLPKIDERKLIKENLKCESFSWFLDNIWPQNFFPTKNRLFGQIKHLNSNYCIQTPINDIGSNIGRLELVNCANSFYKKQLFVYDKQGWIMTDDSLCVDVNQLNYKSRNLENSYKKANVVLFACSEQKRQKWKVNEKLNQIIHVVSGLCLDIKKRFLILNECNSSKNQIFKFNLIKLWI